MTTSPQPGDLDPTTGKYLVDPLCICGLPHPCPIHWADEFRAQQEQRLFDIVPYDRRLKAIR